MKLEGKEKMDSPSPQAGKEAPCVAYAGEADMNEIVMYQTEDEQTHIKVQFEGDTVWLNQQQMASLFQQTKQNISLHINNCFKEKELDRRATVKESLTAAADRKRYSVKFYNLDVIISVGYRVKSLRPSPFLSR